MLKNTRTLWLTATVIVAVGLLTAIICININNKKEDKNPYPQILNDLYQQTETAIKSYISLSDIMEDVVAYEKAYVENPDWENLKNFRIATTYAKTALRKVPVDVIELTDEQLDIARKSGFDVSAFINYCDTELKAQMESNYSTVSGRTASIENFTVDSEYEGLKNNLITDEKTISWNKDYLLLELQYLWADFPEFNIHSKLAKKFPGFIDCNHNWKTDKNEILEKVDDHLAKFEEILAEQNRMLGNDEAMLEIDTEEGLKAKVIDGLPTMVPDPFWIFPEDIEITTVYKTKEKKEINVLNVSEAVALAEKCTITYKTVSYDQYIDYLSYVDGLGFEKKENESDSTETVIYTVAKSDYQVKYENGTVTIEIDNIDTMVLVPTWYMMAVSPELFNKTDKKPAISEEKKQVDTVILTSADDFEMPEEDKKQVQLAWDNTVGHFYKQFAAVEKILEYEKAYIENPTAKNLLNLQIMTHLGMKELESSKHVEYIIVSEDIKNKMPSKESYERAVKNCTFIDNMIKFAMLDRKSTFDNHFWYNAYYKDTENFLKQDYENQIAILKECKNQLSYTVYLISQNLSKKQGEDFINTLNKRYPQLVNNVQLTAVKQSEDYKTQALNNINYLYDELSNSANNIDAIMEQQTQQEKKIAEVLQNLGSDKDCFTSPDGIASEKTIPWIFSFIDAECTYIMFDNAKNKPYTELTPEDINSYSITYPYKTYEDALEGINRLDSKGLVAIKDATGETEHFCRWKVEKNGKTIIYEWDQDKVTMYFPDSEIMIVPYGWYHYFR